MTTNIAWIDGSALFTNAYRIEINLQHLEAKFTFHQTADTALEDLAVKSYDLTKV